MALLKDRSKDIPANAVIISEDQALTYHWKLIDSWHKTSEVWSIQYGPAILGILSAATGIYINNYYRTKLRLGHYGRGSSYLPIVALPAIMSALYHRGFIQKAIILETDKCAVCTQVRSASFQMGFGLIYPTLLAPMASFMFATRHFTYKLPPIIEQPKEVVALLFKMTKPLSAPLSILVGFHGLVAMLLTHKEMKQFYLMRKYMYDMEKKYENERIENQNYENQF